MFGSSAPSFQGCGLARHRAGQPPEEVAPGEHLADLGLDAAEVLGPGRLDGLQSKPPMKSSFTARRMQPWKQNRGMKPVCGKKLLALSVSP